MLDQRLKIQFHKDHNDDNRWAILLAKFLQQAFKSAHPLIVFKYLFSFQQGDDLSIWDCVISQSPINISSHEPIFGPPASNWLWLIWCNADSAQQQRHKGGSFVVAFFLIEIPTCIYCPFTLRLIREGWRYHQFQIFGLGITNDVRCYNLHIAPGIIEHRTDNLLG